jgi:hypothetical protein
MYFVLVIFNLAAIFGEKIPFPLSPALLVLQCASNTCYIYDAPNYSFSENNHLGAQKLNARI